MVVSRKTAIVTGAAGGIGRVLVTGALEAGFQVALVDRDRGGLDKVAAEVANPDQQDCLFNCVTDISKEEECVRAVKDIAAQFGNIDALVNAAGIGMVVIRDSHMVEPVRFDEVSAEQWDHFFAINTKGPFLMAKAALPYLSSAGWGRVVNVTTSMDTMYRSGFCPYGPSKAALEAATAIWAQELDGSGVTVNVLTPGGPTDTPMLGQKLPFARRTMIRPEVMQAPLKWLLSKDSDGVNGRRFIGRYWDPTLPSDQAAKAAGGPAAWPGSGQGGVWPTTDE